MFVCMRACVDVCTYARAHARMVWGGRRVPAGTYSAMAQAEAKHSGQMYAAIMHTVGDGGLMCIVTPEKAHRQRCSCAACS